MPWWKSMLHPHLVVFVLQYIDQSLHSFAYCLFCLSWKGFFSFHWHDIPSIDWSVEFEFYILNMVNACSRFIFSRSLCSSAFHSSFLSFSLTLNLSTVLSVTFAIKRDRYQSDLRNEKLKMENYHFSQTDHMLHGKIIIKHLVRSSWDHGSHRDRE